MHTAAHWIEHLGLQPHPEGGHYAETYRAAATVHRGPDARSASTAIYYLLAHGDCSRLHRIRSDELWHFYSGHALTVHVIDPAGAYTALRVGLDLAAGERPQQVVPAGCWFGATVDAPGGWALVGCTVAPGFDFTDLEFGERSALLAACPDHRDVIVRLTPERP